MYEAWHEAAEAAGDPSEREGYKGILKLNEFLVCNIWMYVVEDDIEVPARRSHVSRQDAVQGKLGATSSIIV